MESPCKGLEVFQSMGELDKDFDCDRSSFQNYPPVLCPF